ncbi:hypothetical protein OE88DRAFT_1730435 [Heliocybe sulcata]|uniref:Uncharacterized protein n=1 Tax=Heliocybe sulcata TaxID=5364 RepID=A0A5C3NLH9_9AGAM|nr:hypothetical protein OE88DRAFT_1730435 [Heliocybe sulcata]
MERVVGSTFDWIPISGAQEAIFIPLWKNHYYLDATQISLLASSRWRYPDLPHFDMHTTRIYHSLVPEDVPLLPIRDPSHLELTDRNTVFLAMADPANYVIHQHYDRPQPPIPRRKWVSITGIGHCCWLDRIVGIDPRKQGHIIMQGWQYEHYEFCPARIKPFHILISINCLTLPCPWSCITSLSTITFIRLAVIFDDNLYGMYKELQKYARWVNDGNFMDVDDEAESASQLECKDNWLGLFDEIIIYDPSLYDDGSCTEREHDKDGYEDIWELSDEDEEEDEDEDDGEEGPLGWYLGLF